jgi:hypothetical protein
MLDEAIAMPAYASPNVGSPATAFAKFSFATSNLLPASASIATP